MEETADSVTYALEGSELKWFRIIENIRQQNTVPELTIHAKNGEVVVAHRLILSARFPYLKQLFMGDPQQGNVNIHWPRFYSSSIELVVSFAYTGKITVSMENVLRIFLMAKSLRSTILQRFCIQFLNERISIENLVMIWNFAMGSNSMSIKRLCIRVMIAHFTDLVSTDLLDSLEFQYLLELLQAKDLNVDYEETKVAAVSSWFKAGYGMNASNDRLSDLLPLLVEINWRLVSITMDNLPDIWELATASDYMILMQLCLQAMVKYFTELVPTDLFISLEFEYLLAILQCDDLVVAHEDIKWEGVSRWIIAGDSELEENPRLIYLSALVYEINWSVYPRDKTVDLMVDNLILEDAKCRYILGSVLKIKTAWPTTYAVGQTADTDLGISVFQINPIYRREVAIGKLAHRSLYSMAKLHDSLYIIGGRRIVNRQLASIKDTASQSSRRSSSIDVKGVRPKEDLLEDTDLVEILDVKSKTLKQGSQINKGRAEGATASSTDEILLCGGSIKGRATKDVEVFTGSKWSAIKKLQESRLGCGVVWLPNGNIYVIGGWNDEQDLASVEMLNRPWRSVDSGSSSAALQVSRNNWGFIAPMNVARSYMGAIAYKGNIIVAGGKQYHGDCLDSVELIQPAEDGSGQWTMLQDMREPMEVSSFIEYSNQLYAFGPTMVQKCTIATEDFEEVESFEDWYWQQLPSIKGLSDCKGVASILAASNRK